MKIFPVTMTTRLLYIIVQNKKMAAQGGTPKRPLCKEVTGL